MSILSGPQIRKYMDEGLVHISPYDPAALNTNSYNVRVGREFKVYSKVAHQPHDLPLSVMRSPFHPALLSGRDEDLAHFNVLDLDRDDEMMSVTVDDAKGIVLVPGVLYLAATIEVAGSCCLVPKLDGRSSGGRKGLIVHYTAGFGDVGFGREERPATWTLEISVIHPMRVRPGRHIAQVSFETVLHDDDLGPLPQYDGKYADQQRPEGSRMWQE